MAAKRMDPVPVRWAVDEDWDPWTGCRFSPEPGAAIYVVRAVPRATDRLPGEWETRACARCGDNVSAVPRDGIGSRVSRTVAYAVDGATDSRGWFCKPCVLFVTGIALPRSAPQVEWGRGSIGPSPHVDGFDILGQASVGEPSGPGTIARMVDDLAALQRRVASVENAAHENADRIDGFAEEWPRMRSDLQQRTEASWRLVNSAQSTACEALNVTKAWNAKVESADWARASRLANKASDDVEGIRCGLLGVEMAANAALKAACEAKDTAKKWEARVGSCDLGAKDGMAGRLAGVEVLAQTTADCARKAADDVAGARQKAIDAYEAAKDLDKRLVRVEAGLSTVCEDLAALHDARTAEARKAIEAVLARNDIAQAALRADLASAPHRVAIRWAGIILIALSLSAVVSFAWGGPFSRLVRAGARRIADWEPSVR